jgi:hypothetical protein
MAGIKRRRGPSRRIRDQQGPDVRRRAHERGRATGVGRTRGAAGTRREPWLTEPNAPAEAEALDATAPGGD